MKVFGKELQYHCEGHSEMEDITHDVQMLIMESNIKAGLVNVSVIGSTASITTIEFEPALAADMKDFLEKLVSERQPTRHGSTWGDDNGFSHLRASLMGPGISLPVAKGMAVLGTWQQIVLIDHDNRPRQRRIYVQVMGE
ncbi:MAG TPA: YjbQ family protein [Candidatus Marinimicrobia bacterium]|nr:YjbQ family protein [Candidatus Neomarinimicrobiota bacterium]